MCKKYNKKVCIWVSVSLLGFLSLSPFSFAKDSGVSPLSVMFNDEVVASSLSQGKKSDNILSDKSIATYLPHVQFGATQFFGQMKESKSALGANLFIPLAQESDWLVFTDLRLYDRSGKPFEGNVHLGFRQLRDNNQRLWGAYFAFDRKRTKNNNYFNQLTFGGEHWYKRWFLGGNAYMPIGQTERLLNRSSVVTDTNLDTDHELVRNGAYKNIWEVSVVDRSENIKELYEKSMGGIDFETGYEIINGLVAYVGVYYFDASGAKEICGRRARLTYEWSLDNGKRILGAFDQVGFGAELQRDRERGTIWSLSVNLRLGWLASEKSQLHGVARHMTDLVRRDVDIVSGKADKKEEKKEKRKKVAAKVIMKPGAGRPLNIVDVDDSEKLVKALKDKMVDHIVPFEHIDRLDHRAIYSVLSGAGGRGPGEEVTISHVIEFLTSSGGNKKIDVASRKKGSISNVAKGPLDKFSHIVKIDGSVPVVNNSIVKNPADFHKESFLLEITRKDYDTSSDKDNFFRSYTTIDLLNAFFPGSVTKGKRVPKNAVKKRYGEFAKVFHSDRLDEGWFPLGVKDDGYYYVVEAMKKEIDSRFSDKKFTKKKKKGKRRLVANDAIW